MISLILSLFLISTTSEPVGYTDIEFKTEKIKKQYEQLYSKNIELYQIVKYAAFILGKTITITEVYRTQEEQDRYYKGKPKFKSPHQRWLAVDIRTRDLSASEIKLLTTSINSMYNLKNRYIPTAFYHNMGLGPHIHIQFKERQ